MQAIADNRPAATTRTAISNPRVSTVTHLRHAGLLNPLITGGQSKFEMQFLRHRYRPLIQSAASQKVYQLNLLAIIDGKTNYTAEFGRE